MAKKTLVAVRHPLVQNIVNEQIGNLTQRHSRKDGVYRYLKVVLDDFCQEVAHLTMSSAGSRPRIGQPGWKREVANLSNFLCNRTGEFDVLFDRTRRQISRRFPKAVKYHGFVSRSLTKLADVVATVSLMVIHGYNPDFLILTHKEGNELMREISMSMAHAGVSTALIGLEHDYVLSIPHMGSPATN